MKPAKHQRSKQTGHRDLFWKVHDRAQSFGMRSYTMPLWSLRLKKIQAWMGFEPMTSAGAALGFEFRLGPIFFSGLNFTTA